MGDNPAGKLLRSVEGAAYWAAVAPALARLPAALGYRLACWHGDLLFRYQTGKRTELARLDEPLRQLHRKLMAAFSAEELAELSRLLDKTRQGCEGESA